MHRYSVKSTTTDNSLLRGGHEIAEAGSPTEAVEGCLDNAFDHGASGLDRVTERVGNTYNVGYYRADGKVVHRIAVEVEYLPDPEED